MDMHFVGIDIGTSSISGVAYNYENKEVESITRDNDSNLPSPKSWEKIQAPGRIMEQVQEILADFSSRYPNIKGIGLTGQMHGILYVNHEGDAISPLYTWQDGRGNQSYLEDKTYASFLSELTGYDLASGYGLTTHFFNSINDLVPKEAKKISTIMDYVVMKLANKKTPLTDYSNGASLGFFDLEKLEFDHAAIEKANIDCKLLPELTQSTTCCGYFEDRIPIYSAIGDNQAAFLGSVKDLHKSIHITVGTSSQISVYSEHFLNVQTLDTRPFPGGGYLLVGAALSGGQAFAMLKTFFEKTLEKFAAKIPLGLDIYQIMTDIGYKDNSNDLPVVETLFNGARFTSQKRGHIENISFDNFTPENLILGFLKGISLELFNFYQHLPSEIKNEKHVIIGSGNALKRNPLLCSAFEEQFKTQLICSNYQEEAAFGACLNAIIGSGCGLSTNG
ncbi:FGGY family carbohydrate kinase [Pedobacter sp. B4-66]|uniref:sedoheptulokinase n=1 Tax=Pedobacter sp. B4-66 TaxID=2817280 RepID=UPI001BDB1FB8|nr:FGGY family carbohydrate kinase [Pedobacter sp. B4-66]